MPIRLCPSRYASSLGPLRPYRRVARPCTCYVCFSTLFAWVSAPLDLRAQSRRRQLGCSRPPAPRLAPLVFPASAGSSTCLPDRLVWGPTASCQRRRARPPLGLGPLCLRSLRISFNRSAFDGRWATAATLDSLCPGKACGFLYFPLAVEHAHNLHNDGSQTLGQPIHVSPGVIPRSTLPTTLGVTPFATPPHLHDAHPTVPII